MAGYWRFAHKRALRATCSLLGLQSWGRIVIIVLVAIVAVAALWLFGSEGASQNELLWRVALTGAVVAIFPLVYFFQMFVAAPAQIYREKINEINSLKEAISSNIRPEVDLFFVLDNGIWLLELRNKNVQAVYTVKIDLSKAGVRERPSYPVNAAWADKSKDKERMIADGFYDRVILCELNENYFMYDEYFWWISGNEVIRKKSIYSWTPISDPGVPPQNHIIRVHISSDPPLLGGSRAIEVELEGRQLRVISGEAQILQ